jgi:excisionase family DNA binding protein
MSATALNDGRQGRRRKAPVGVIERRWYSVKEVAEMLGYGESKVRFLIISGDLRSLKDGGCRRILPAWVDEYVAMRVAEAEADWP